MIVDENLETSDESGNIVISGSQCIDNIRTRLPLEFERRMLAIVRSANDSTSDIALYNKVSARPPSGLNSTYLL
jgi:hypothetical protein